MMCTMQVVGFFFIQKKINTYNATIKFCDLFLCRLSAEIEEHKWRDLELNFSKTVEELCQDSQLIQANSMKKLRDNKKLLECSFAQI